MVWQVAGGRAGIHDAEHETSLFLLVCVSFYVLAAMLAFPLDFTALLLPNFWQLEYFGIPFTLAMLAGESVIKDRNQPALCFVSLCRERGNRLLAYHILLVFGLAAYTTFKVNIPQFVPFYADPYLLSLDNALHGGQPWEYLHRLPQWFGSWIELTYTRLWAVLLVALPYGIAIWARGAVAKRYMWALFFTYGGIGTVLASVLSSVGPIFFGDFYAEDPYAQLRERVFANPHLPDIQLYTRYLLDNFNSTAPAFGTGISAMPSVHVASATLIAWALTSFGRPTAIIGWIFVISIELGSVYSGWHYATDGYVSFILVSVFWIWLSRRFGLPLMPSGKSWIPEGRG